MYINRRSISIKHIPPVYPHRRSFPNSFNICKLIKNNFFFLSEINLYKKINLKKLIFNGGGEKKKKKTIRHYFQFLRSDF